MLNQYKVEYSEDTEVVSGSVVEFSITIIMFKFAYD